MSETVSTAGAGTSASQATGASSNQTSQQAGSQASAGSPGSAEQTQRAQSQGQTETTSQAQERILAEQDLDAYIEHTINGRKEKIKVRDLTKAYGLDKTANQRMQEAAAEKKRVQQMLHSMQDPDKYFEMTGKNKQEWLKSQLANHKDMAEEILAKEYELQQMDPHQRKAMELEQELQTMKQRELSTKQPIIDEIKKLVPANMLPQGLENATQEQLHGFLQAKQQEFQQGLDNMQNEILNAWEKTGLPREKDFGSWMAQVMMDHERRAAEHKKRTGEDLPPLLPEQAADKVKQRFLRSSQALYDQMDGASIASAIGEKAAEKLREYYVELASRGNGPRFDSQQNRPAQQAASEPKKYLNQVEWRKEMGIL